MSLRSRHELLCSVGPRYRVARRKDKELILDEFIAVTGYHRKYAISLLRETTEPLPAADKKPPRRRRDYTDAVREALIVIWQAANRLCSKRLAPFLPEFISVLEKHGHLCLADEVREKLRRISSATVDRLLYEVRHSGRRGVGTTRSGTLLKHQIPIRTFADWDDLKCGFLEVDLVAHCGTSTGGAYLSTMTLTDVATSWTECLALLSHHQEEVVRGLREVQELLPFPLLGLDTDNGTEFINSELLRFCHEEELTFTRSRPYKKNDQCHVEQKNGSVVRRMVGYDRYEGSAACRQLASLYGVLRLYVNFFQPSLKLVSKQRVGAKVIKKYDQAQTPYQRILTSVDIAAEFKTRLRMQYQQLDPVLLLRDIEGYQDSLWQYAWRPAESVTDLQNDGVVMAPTVPRRDRKPAPPKEDSPEEVKKRYWHSSGKPTKYHLVKHIWRTRPDPFVLVWDQVEARLDQDANQCTKQIFLDLQRDYPGQFKDVQLRTLQRRVKEWRAKRALPCEVIIHPAIKGLGERPSQLGDAALWDLTIGAQDGGQVSSP
ncbi:MAG: transposase family protein [Acidobacteriota bacterium]